MVSQPLSRRRALLRCGSALALSALASVSFLLPASRAQQSASKEGAPSPPRIRPVPGPEFNASASYTVTIDAAQERHAINPMIYGVNYASNAQLTDLNVVLHRMGGNNTSRYNWQLNADNRGNDWYYQSIGESSATPGERADSFISASKNNGAEPMMTIPMVGWVAKLGPGRSKLASFSVAKYGAQQATDWEWFPDAGNGVRPDGTTLVTGNDPNDANVPADHNFMKPWIEHMVDTFGTASAGGLRYYIYDNEPSIWHSTHRDVHPTGARMTEVRDKIIAYGTMIRGVDPSALLVGPEEWGWSGYLYSGYDLQYGEKNGWGYLPDRAANGNMDYMPWLLQQLHQHETQTGVRLLDVFSLHIYPQGGEFGGGTSQSLQLRRNRSTRSLWDPNYVDETWINDRVRLIPRMKEWVNTYYPGLKTAITEYSWGAEDHINGATTQADILGIFGREGLDMATRWVTPETSTPTYKAFKMYRNYDGARGTFGETNIRATSNSNADVLSSFASLRAKDGALTVMIVNKALADSHSVTLNLANFAPGSAAQVWQLTSANRINRLADVAVSGTSLTLTVPQQSITHVIIPPAPTGLVKGPGIGLEKYEGDATGIMATVELRQPGTRTVVETLNLPLLSPGALYFTTARRGTFDVSVKGGTFLRKTFANVSVGANGASLPTVTLTNGDADGDNVVNAGDVAIVSRALGSVAGGARWDARADLNGDGRVSQADYDIVLANFRQRGDN